jgi:hypothetical protein
MGAKIYDKAVDETQYEVGDEVFVFHPPGLLEVGRSYRRLGEDRTSSTLSSVESRTF